MDDRLEKLTDWVDTGLSSPARMTEISNLDSALTPEECYRIQTAVMDRRVANGDRIIGYKAALTSKAMQRDAGISEPLLGTLLASRHYSGNEPVSFAGFLDPTLEPEVAVVMRSDLSGPGVTVYAAMTAIAGYLPAVELGDYRSDRTKRNIQQSLVCNTFNGGFTTGSTLSAPEGLDLRLEGMVMEVNGEVRASATAVEVLGDPLQSVVFMANKLAEQGRSLKAGMVLLTGSIVKGISLEAGDEVRVDFTRLGRLVVKFVA